MIGSGGNCGQENIYYRTLVKEYKRQVLELIKKVKTNDFGHY